MIGLSLDGMRCDDETFADWMMWRLQYCHYQRSILREAICCGKTGWAEREDKEAPMLFSNTATRHRRNNSSSSYSSQVVLLSSSTTATAAFLQLWFSSYYIDKGQSQKTKVHSPETVTKSKTMVLGVIKGKATTTTCIHCCSLRGWKTIAGRLLK